MKINSSTCNTPCKPNNISEATPKSNQRNVQRDLFPTTPTETSSTTVDRKNNSVGKQISGNDFMDLNESFHKKSFDRCSTPLRSTDNNFSGNINTSTPQIRSFDDRNSSSRNNTSNNNNTANNSNSFCLADFIVTNKNKQIKRKSHNQSTNNNNNNSVSNCSNASTLSNSSSKNNTHNDSAPIKRRAGPTRRRIVPTKIQSNSTKSVQSMGHEFFTSSFKSDNNLLNVMTEEKERNSNHVSRDRETLLEEKLSIKHEFDLQKNRNGGSPCIQQINKILEKSIPKSSPDKFVAKQNDSVNLGNISNKFYLDNLIKIYSHIIDLNLITNILNELSYLFNLININVELNEARVSSVLNNNNNNIDYKYNLLLKTINNCIYFSFGVLDRQKFTLSLLDTKTLKVLIANERMVRLNTSLHGYLKKLYEKKINLNYTSLENNTNSNASNVFYQEETDTRNNYPSENEFRIFIKQRDLFYTIFRKWEYQYSNPKSNLNVRLDHKVAELITALEHPINMQHLSKLFVAQLILSCNFDDTLPELQNELPNIDLNKLSKLQQRLVAPSYFSTEYMFPGIQGFFKEFILHGQFSNIFIEQLKAALIHELLLLNEDLSQEERFEDTIRPINISTMRVLAKFIGFIVSLPYKYDNRGNLGVDETQIKFRNMTLPQFDVRTVLIKSVKENRILITIPWIVQYLTMLDHITIQLNYYKAVLKILYEIYIKIDYIALDYHPTSKFIIHACLGWLFQEIPLISDEYYTYRRNYSIINPLTLGGKDNGTNNWELIEVIIPSKLQNIFVKSSLPIEMANFEIKNDQITCIITNQSPVELNPASVRKPRNLDCTKFESLNVNLENLLNIACPFLADFRISIMPANYTKTVSRSGKYRYIRTNLTDPKTPNKDSSTSTKQQKLLDEFLQSQSQSTKKTIDFIIERTISAVIKDYQIEYLLPTKDKTIKIVNNIIGNSFAEVKEKMLVNYADGLRELTQQWNDNLPGMIRERVTNSFNALLPKETLDVLKTTYIAFAVQKCIVKTNEWKTTHCSSIQFFTKDVKADAEKLYQKIKYLPKSPDTSVQIPVTDLYLTLNEDCPIPSQVYSDLMIQLNRASRTPYLIVYDEVMRLFDDLFIFMTQQILTADLYKTTGFLVIQLLQFLICNLPMCCDDMLLNRFIDFMKISKFEPFLKFDDMTIDDDEPRHYEEQTVDTNFGRGSVPKRNTNYLFNAFLSGCLLELITNSTNTSWNLLAQFIINLIDNQFYSLNLFNEQYLSLFKYNLSPLMLENLSNLMDRVLQHYNRTSAECDYESQQTQLFSEMLTDLTREMDNL